MKAQTATRRWLKENKKPLTFVERRSDYQMRVEAHMERIADMPVKVALARGLVFLCPVCRVLHPGIRFGLPDHRPYCSGACFRAREREEE